MSSFHGDSIMTALRRGAALFVLLMMSTPIASSSVSADGMSVYYEPGYSWRLIAEDSQFAIINHDGEHEDILLQIGVPSTYVNDASSLFWIFPIPAQPEYTQIGVVDSFPAFGGHFLSDSAKLSVTEDLAWIYSSQIYPIPFALMSVYTANEDWSVRRTLSGGGSWQDSVPSDLEVFQRIEQSGLSTELIGTQDAAALDEYLSTYGIELPESSVPVIQGYADEGFSFVASRISNITEFLATSQQRDGYNSVVYGMSVEVWFPTDRIYYPMRLTSVYGSTGIPIVLQIVDFVTPVAPVNQSTELRIDHYYCLDRSYSVGEGLEWFFPEHERSGQLRDGVISDLEYTLVIVDADADEMTQDLWFEESASSETALDSFMVDHGWAALIPAFFGISMLASVLAGSLTYRGLRPRRGRFALLGLANGTTIVGFALVARWLNVDTRFVGLEPQQDSVFPIGPRLRSFVLSFSLIFVGLSFALHIILNHLIL
jgi:Uncharacterized protein conserved in bacteria (DUF2330)